MNLIIKINDVMGDISIKTDYKHLDDFDGNLYELNIVVVKAVEDIFIKAAELHTRQSIKTKLPQSDKILVDDLKKVSPGGLTNENINLDN